jgi:glutamine amidotransferase
MIAVIDYGLGNIGSILNAMDRLGIKTIKTSSPDDISKSEALIFPGDGAAAQAMKNLQMMKLIKPIKDFIRSGKPFLGICLGMQILLSFSEEGNVKCLDIIRGKVKKFNTGLKVPQIGWNQVVMKQRKIKKLFRGIPDKSYFYFINSYYCEPEDKSIVIAETDYGNKFYSIFIKDNITGVQFHPEKSGKVGFQFLRNWSGLC